MVVSPKLLMGELKALRRGRGVQAPGIDRQVGPALREACGINESDGAQVVREKLDAWVSTLVRTLPEDLKLAVVTPLALNTEAQHAFLTHRIQWLASREDRDSRTIRRRIDDGLTRLVEAAIRPGPTTPDGWYVVQLHTLLRLDRVAPVSTERWSITAAENGMDEIPWPVTTKESDVDVRFDDVRVVHGVELTEFGRRPRLRLPRPLRAGETYEFSLEVPLPQFHRTQQDYIFRPQRRCDRFDLVVRFHPNRLPLGVSKVTEVCNCGNEHEEPLAVNAFGEVEVPFRDVLPGGGYGIRWIN